MHARESQSYSNEWRHAQRPTVKRASPTASIAAHG